MLGNHSGESVNQNLLQPWIDFLGRLPQEISSVNDVKIFIDFMLRRKELNNKKHLANNLSYEDQRLIEDASAVLEKYSQYVRELQDP